LEGHSLITTVYDVTFVVPTVHEGNFVWEGDAEDAEAAFTEYLDTHFPEGSAKLLEFKIAEDQNIDIPLQYDKERLN
jgi:hypothetical protein